MLVRDTETKQNKSRRMCARRGRVGNARHVLAAGAPTLYIQEVYCPLCPWICTAEMGHDRCCEFLFMTLVRKKIERGGSVDDAN
jgi:hypothetical protein